MPPCAGIAAQVKISSALMKSPTAHAHQKAPTPQLASVSIGTFSPLSTKVVKSYGKASLTMVKSSSITSPQHSSKAKAVSITKKCVSPSITDPLTKSSAVMTPIDSSAVTPSVSSYQNTLSSQRKLGTTSCRSSMPMTAGPFSSSPHEAKITPTK